VDEALPSFPIDFEDNHPLEVRFASLAKIPFVIAVSFFAAIQMHANSDLVPTEGCNHQSGWSDGSRSTIQGMSKVTGFRERFQGFLEL
jgi:hypothetical protein